MKNELRSGRTHLLVLVICIISLMGYRCSGSIEGNGTQTRLNINSMQNELRLRVEGIAQKHTILILDSKIQSTIVLPAIYDHRAYMPCWFNEFGMRPIGDSLVAFIEGIGTEGFRPSDYHSREIRTLLEKYASPKDTAGTCLCAADLDLLLTDAFLTIAAHFLGGRINPETLEPDWSAYRREADIAEMLQKALDSGNIRDILDSLLPRHEQYRLLRKKLIQYKNTDTSNYQTTVLTDTLKPGDSHSGLKLLRKKLHILGDLNKESPTDSGIYDSYLEAAIKSFQKRHGLLTDGRLNALTQSQLNISLESRMSLLRINMERWRWLPEDLGDYFMLVNIANFELDLIETDRLVFSTQAVVGKAYRKTPVFSDHLSYLVFNPYWEVPRNIALNDILPRIKKSKSYLKDQGIRILDGWGSDSRFLNPDSIRWDRVNINNYNYRLRQDPGPLNALGKVKFMFPNKYNVYLHDSPAKDLFNENVRTFSSGCIRIKDWKELTRLLLERDKEWQIADIDKILNHKTSYMVSLNKPVPIHIVYMTAWTDDENKLNVRPDIYGRDQNLKEALSERAPGLEE